MAEYVYKTNYVGVEQDKNGRLIATVIADEGDEAFCDAAEEFILGNSGVSMLIQFNVSQIVDTLISMHENPQTDGMLELPAKPKVDALILELERMLQKLSSVKYDS